MSKKISTTLLFTVVMAVFALLTTTQAIAQYGCDTVAMCTTPNGWTIELVSGPGDAETCTDDDNSNSYTCYEYSYKVCKAGSGEVCNTSKLNHVYLAIPDCCFEGSPGEILLFAKVDESHPVSYPVGEGEPTFDWLKNYLQAYASKYTPNPGDGQWGFRATTATVGETTVCVKAGKSFDCCEIKGPWCKIEQIDPEPQFFTYSKTDPASGKTCEMTVHLEPDFAIELPAGSACTARGPYEISTLEMTAPGHADGITLDMQAGWFTFYGSPTEYCYYNKKKKKYVCVTY